MQTQETIEKESTSLVVLRDDFYKDGFNKVLLLLGSLCLAILLLIALGIYLYTHKPQPLLFMVQDEWRIQSDVKLDDPYLSIADVFQWVNDVFNKAFNFDFVQYNNELSNLQPYFTENGWNVFLNHLNVYANYKTIQDNRLFVSGSPAGAPSLLNQGFLTGRYFWLVELPVTIRYAGLKPLPVANIKVQVRVVRVSTLNNLAGVGIDDVFVINNNPLPLNTSTTVGSI